jgi:hypothetical protein
MSALGDFVKSAIAQAFPTIGTKSIAIAGGTGVACVTNERSYSEDSEDSGFVPMVEFTAIIRTSVFLAAYTSAPKSYVGRTAVIDNEKFRVTEVSVGSEHVSIRMQTIVRQ